jgi:hypothetical protein
MRRQGEFQIVCGLWLSPDFSDALAGRKEPPWVNHSNVVFSAVHRALSDLFPAGPRVEIQVPNDTIDQVAVHVRQDGRRGRSIRCEDFGTALLQAAKREHESVIDVSKSWAPLHALKTRSKAPPPAILPFVVTAPHFDNAMIWLASARPSLGLPAVPYPDQENKYNGTLPTAFIQRLGKIFGVPYEPMCVLDCMCMDEPPAGTS